MPNPLFNSTTLSLNYKVFSSDVIMIADKLGVQISKSLNDLLVFMPDSQEMRAFKAITSEDFLSNTDTYAALAFGIVEKNHILYSIGQTYTLAHDLYKEEVEYILYDKEPIMVESFVKILSTYGYFSAVGFVEKLLYNAWVITISDHFDLYLDYVSILNSPSQTIDIVKQAKFTIETFLSRDSLLYMHDIAAVEALGLTIENKFIDQISVYDEFISAKELQKI